MTKIRPIQCLGIVNRGEAAMRCLRAVKVLRELEGGTLKGLVLYTDADLDAPFVRCADRAIRLPTRGSPVEAYLDHALVMDAVRQGGADAVWPGWGLLAEDPVFVESVVGQGLRFLGPSADAMRRLGDKIAAKQLAESLGVPVLPWSRGEVVDVDAALQHARVLGYPLVIKASAGGGGRGIRVVDGAGDMPAAFRSAVSEARAAFGDGRVIIERKAAPGRHVEVQIAGDQYGKIVSLGCRDCSVQRRHQKVVEEAPPPELSRAERHALEEAAVALVKTAGYCGVGTVEFLLNHAGFYFLEVNPRLQVEHGVTEVITGIDLVQLQIRIAQGEPLAGLACDERGVAIEARVCAEDPDAAFRPSPGHVARFIPPTGPRVRVDSGVATGTTVPAEFDSLIAKVIATGATREEARASLACALGEFELVIAGGANNRGYLLELLDDPDYRAARVDTGWLDRRSSARGDSNTEEFAAAALVVAAVLTYQQTRDTARLNFYVDTMDASPTRVPSSVGQELDLSYRGQPYRLAVFAIGSWRYRVRLDGRVAVATFREESSHSGHLLLGERYYRVLFDIGEAELRVEVEGRPHRFRRQGAGEVRASTPAMVVAVHVRAGERVKAGDALGLLEAMKMEVAFHAPVAGIVSEVRVREGQQVAAGDILLVIDPAPAAPAEDSRRQPIGLPESPDPLSVFFPTHCDGGVAPDLQLADEAQRGVRAAAIEAAREEIRRLLLGFDVDPQHGAKLLAFLEAPLPEGLSEGFLRELGETRHELRLFADIEQLFLRTPRASVSGAMRPSNNARLRMYVRRMRAGGAGVAPGFLALVQRALRHYEVQDLSPSEALERAVLRLLASQRAPELRHRLVAAMVRRVVALARTGVSVGGSQLVRVLSRITRMRGLVPDELADAAIEASYVILEEPVLQKQSAEINARIDAWIAASEAELASPPEDLLVAIVNAPRPIFESIRRWIDHPDPPRRALALAAHLRWIYAPSIPLKHRAAMCGLTRVERFEFPDGGIVLGSTCSGTAVEHTARCLCEEAATLRAADQAVAAIELLVSGEPSDVVALGSVALRAFSENPAAGRLTLSVLPLSGGAVHRTFVVSGGGVVERIDLHALHPETAGRIDLDRLTSFDLERLQSADGVYSFHGRSRDVPGDERIFVLVDVREHAVTGSDAAPYVAAFERAFHTATRTLRTILGTRADRRRLQWNRIALYFAPFIFLERATAQRLSRRLVAASRHLGLEKVVVRVNVQERGQPQETPEAVEIVFADPTGTHLEIAWRKPRRKQLHSASDYERKVAEARRRGLVYPYQVIRMLTTGVQRDGSDSGGSDLPAASFDEYDLAGEPNGTAVEVVGRPYGSNTCSVVFGVISTPTDLVPEGMRRVLILSDPTLQMGSLAAPECDRIVAALDLAERLKLPVEWVPVSSGARIAMDSGTENLDATARVVRRIVTFTDAGGVIHVIVHGVNVGAQSYFNALSTMHMHSRGVLIMTPGASMVLTGRAALEASGSVAAEDEVSIGGFERIMGPNGEAQYYAEDLADAYRILYQYYRYTYVVPGEDGPRRRSTADTPNRSIGETACEPDEQNEFGTVGDIFDEEANPGRKRPFAMREVMQALIDQDGGHLERWRAQMGGETAIVWDASLGGYPVCLIGIESQNVPREGYRPLDGPPSWTGGTLFPLSSKKVARALNAASGSRPAVILANLSGFDGSPESMRKLQLEYGAEIARAVVNFKGPLLFVVVSRYHGGAYVVFSQQLNDHLVAIALTGSYASVIGGSAAAAVVFGREVQARVAADPRVGMLGTAIPADAGEKGVSPAPPLSELVLEKQAQVAAEFDAIHTVERALRVGSLHSIVPLGELRPYLVGVITRMQASPLPVA